MIGYVEDRYLASFDFVNFCSKVAFEKKSSFLEVSVQDINILVAVSS